MSISFNKIYCPSPSFHLQDLNEVVIRNNVVFCTQTRTVINYLFKSKTVISGTRHHFIPSFTYGGHIRAHAMSDSHIHPAKQKDSVEREDTQREKSWSTTKVLEQLKRYGVSGVLSYGLLNTAYYLTTFLTVWLYIAPAPGKMGYLAAVTRFLKVMAMVWAGSQVTKLFRAAGALALAPVVDKGLSWFTVNFKFESRGKAFLTLVGFCFGLAIIVFLAVTLLWA